MLPVHMPKRVRILPLILDPLPLLPRFASSQAHTLQHLMNPVMRDMHRVFNVNNPLKYERAHLILLTRPKYDNLLFIRYLGTRLPEIRYLLLNPVPPPQLLHPYLRYTHSLRNHAICKLMLRLLPNNPINLNRIKLPKNEVTFSPTP